MSVVAGDSPGRDRPADPYGVQTREQIARLEEFTVEPVAPDRIADHRSAGETLVTVDVPAHLGPRLDLDVDTSIALYRLVQLFGTPNVPGLEAGTDQPARETRTWQFLFDAVHEPGEGDGWSELLSVYDYKTRVSVGLSAWLDEDEPGFAFPEPVEEPPPWMDLPPEEDLRTLVRLVRTTVEHTVEATYKELWV